MSMERAKIDYEFNSDSEREEIMELAERLDEAVHNFMLKPMCGFDESYVDDFFHIDISSDSPQEYCDVRVYAELGYESLSAMFYDSLDDIIAEYNNDAYFEAETGGVGIARLWW